MSTTPAPQAPPPARIDNIDFSWDATTRALHVECDFHYPGAAGAEHAVYDLPPWRFDYYVGEAAKVNPSVLQAGTDPQVVAANIAQVVCDFQFGWNMPRPVAPPIPPVTGHAPDIT